MRGKSLSLFKLPKKNLLIQRLHVHINGAVQGVGFRPFVYRLATELGLSGWVNNSARGVEIELEGNGEKIDEFLTRVKSEKPPHSSIQKLEYSLLEVVGHTGFEVKQSDKSGDKSVLVLPDIATCSECLKEIFDPDNRRYRYPFTNCTNCGPRYSIIESLPYDRANTTMKIFTMCEKCRKEYENPLNRRFHAQPNACPECGPHLELWDKSGKILASYDEALITACDSIRKGAIVALKGLGGFHLIVDATNDRAVKKLRQRKARQEKPFALMYPNIDSIQADCELSDIERKLLLSPESPIVLLKHKSDTKNISFYISPTVAPDNPYLGIMLPYTPLHHLLMAELGFPVVATSGNYSDEPICIDEGEALVRLGEIADIFLVHDRPIARPVDDSTTRVIMGHQTILRRARGYAPMPIKLKKPIPSTLAVGGHLKNTIAISRGRQVFISQHIGDLVTRQAYDSFIRVIKSLSDLYDLKPQQVSYDKHPDYLSTGYAVDLTISKIDVQHHHAHVLSCMAENELEEPVLGVSWDGTGFGLDGTIWGGEFLKVDKKSFSRVAHMRTFRLPGSEKAIKEPWRTALGMLYEIFGDKLFSMNEIKPVYLTGANEKNIIQKMLKRKINAPLTSSAGRLFDAIASTINLCQTTNFEGQAAMKLEAETENIITGDYYKFDIEQKNKSYVINWEPMILDLLSDLQKPIAIKQVAARFHNTLVEMIVKVAIKVGEKQVVLTGGCFQNKYLTEHTVRRLDSSGFTTYWHRKVPTNDGGLALGQIVAVSRLKK
jgi:hydrogenase maturation protein HypF